MNKLNRPVNFRDIGGYVGYNRNVVKKQLLYRSGELANLSEEDKNILLKKYKIKTIVDFRSSSEKEKSPDDKIHGTEYIHIDIMKNKIEDTVSMENFVKQASKEMVVGFMTKTYEDFITDKEAIAGYREFIDVILKKDTESLVFHCFAGKDRTGFAAAILLTILEVFKEDIFKDYLLTNELRIVDNEDILKQVKKYNLGEKQVEAISEALNVRSEYLEASYKKAKEIYGSLDDYITKGLKVSDEEREFLINKYTDKKL